MFKTTNSYSVDILMLYFFLQETEKGRYYATDDYVAHIIVTKDAKNVFLVTDKYEMSS